VDQTGDLLGTEVKWKPVEVKQDPQTVFLAEDFQVNGNTFVVSPLVANLDLSTLYLIEVFLIYSTNAEIPAFTFAGAGVSPLDGQLVGMISTTTDSEQVTAQAQVFLLPVADGTRATVSGKMVLETSAVVANFYVALCSLASGGQNTLCRGSCIRYQKLSS
jgi:hypothetical protein